MKRQAALDCKGFGFRLCLLCAVYVLLHTICSRLFRIYIWTGFGNWISANPDVKDELGPHVEAEREFLYFTSSGLFSKLGSLFRSPKEYSGLFHSGCCCSVMDHEDHDQLKL